MRVVNRDTGLPASSIDGVIVLKFVASLSVRTSPAHATTNHLTPSHATAFHPASSRSISLGSAHRHRR
jgi:hypothetical protein